MKPERVEELRHASAPGGRLVSGRDVNECLDEIERLRAALEEIVSLATIETQAVTDIARRALEGHKS